METQRREAQIRRHLHKENRMKNIIQAVRWVLAQVRAVFVLLLMVTVMEFIYSHRTQIQQFADGGIINQTIAKVRAEKRSILIRHNTEKPHNEADQTISK